MSRALVGLGEVFVIADGMGGHKGGALAAELTVKGIEEALRAAPSDLDIREAIERALIEANGLVYKQAISGDPETEGMGSTATILLTKGSTAYVGHVGDSRAYLYRERKLRQLTTDHTRVQRMVDAGMLAPAEARDHLEASMLERAIGQKPDIDVEIAPALALNEGDAILLCSDGLTGYVDDDAIEGVLRSKATVQELPDRLIRLALNRGGYDNVTVQYIQYGQRRETAPVNKRRRYHVAAGVGAAILMLIGVGYGMLKTNPAEKPSAIATERRVVRNQTARAPNMRPSKRRAGTNDVTKFRAEDDKSH
jgi:serine/threonine protein phosphatase PrpC